MQDSPQAYRKQGNSRFDPDTVSGHQERPSGLTEAEETVIIDAVMAETESADNGLARHRLKKVYFVSKSKGRGRKRKHLEEVFLIHDNNDRHDPPKWTTWKKFPFDTVATEVYPEMSDGLAAEAKLMKEFSP